MSRFTDATYVVTDSRKRGRKVVCLTSPMAYEIGYLGSGWMIAERPGFCSDLTSVPRISRWFARLLIRTGLRGLLRQIRRFLAYVAKRLARSALVHDACRSNPKMPKLIGDYAFWEAMGVDEVPEPLRTVAAGLALLNFTRD